MTYNFWLDPNDLKKMKASMAITMTIEQWEELYKTFTGIDASSPAAQFAISIRGIIEKANHTLYLREEK